MPKEVKDFVVGQDVRCPICGEEMRISGSQKGKSKFSCVNCGYEI
jgi:transposase-like protein